MIKLEQHHIRYLEIHGEDEIIMLSHEEHKKVHKEDKANGFTPIPEWIVHAAFGRSPKGKNVTDKYRESENGRIKWQEYAGSDCRKEVNKKYAQSIKGKLTRAEFMREKQEHVQRINFMESFGPHTTFREVFTYNAKFGSFNYLSTFLGTCGYILPVIDIEGQNNES